MEKGSPYRHKQTIPCSKICSKRDLNTLSEATDYETGKFLRSTFTYVDKEDKAWFGRMLGVRKYDDS